MLGMTLALRLAQSGQKVTLKEAAPGLGGMAEAWKLGEVTWDRHYHVILLSDRHLIAFLDELGLASELRWTDPASGFFAGERLYPLTSAIDYLRFPEIGFVDKLRLAASIAYASRIRDGLALERVPVSDWLIRLSGRRNFEKIWRPLLRSKLGENYKLASAAFIWAIIRRLYAARRSGLSAEKFGYLPGGYDRILDAFRQHLVDAGVRIEVSSPVSRVARESDGLCVVSDGAAEVFDRVVVTVASPLATKMCDGLAEDEASRHASIRYQGIVCASALLKRRLGSYYLTYITDETLPFTTVIEMTTLIDPEQVGGHTLVYLPKYATADDPVFALSDEQIRDRFLAGLRRMYPDFVTDDVIAFRVSRLPHVLAIPTIDYSSRLPPTSTAIAGLHIVNAAHIVNGTLNVNETVALANETADRLLDVDDPVVPVTRAIDLETV